MSSKIFVYTMLSVGLLTGCADDALDLESTGDATSEVGGSDSTSSTTSTGGSAEGNELSVEAGEVTGGSARCVRRSELLQATLEKYWPPELEVPGGLSFSVMMPDCPVWRGVVGRSTEDLPLHPDMVFRTGSLVKTYMSVLTMRLVEDGVLQLDDTIDTYYEGVLGGDEITIRQLLNHSAGISEYATDEEWVAMHHLKPEMVVTPEQLVEITNARGLTHPPGSVHKYSNTNYIVLGAVIEAATGENVVDLLRTHVIEPVGLEHTYIDDGSAIDEELAHGWGLDDGPLQGGDWTMAFHPSVPWVSGNSIATPLDTLIWLKAIYGEGALLAPESLAEMQMTLPVQDAPFKYGLGVQVRDFGPAGLAYGHSGTIHGYVSSATYAPESGLGIAGATNFWDFGRSDGFWLLMVEIRDLLVSELEG